MHLLYTAQQTQDDQSSGLMTAPGRRSALLSLLWMGYVLALVLTCLCTILIVFIQSGVATQSPLLFPYLLVVLVTAAWGFGPSLLASIASVFLANLYVLPPTDSIFPQTSQDAAINAIYLLVAVATGWIAATARRQWLQAQLLGDQLALQNVESARARRFAEQAHDQAQQRAAELEGVLAAVPDGVIVGDVHNRAKLINNAYAQLIGISKEALRSDLPAGQLASFARQPDGRPLQMDDMPMVRALRGETVINHELLIRRVDGTQRLINVSAVSMAGPQQELTGTVSLIHDVTAERQREQRIRALAAVVRDLAAATDTAVVLDRVVEAAQTLLGVSFSAVFLRDPDGSRLTAAAARGLRDKTVAWESGVSDSASHPSGSADDGTLATSSRSLPSLPLAGSIAGRAMREERTIAMTDLSAEKERVDSTLYPYAGGGEQRSLLVTPIAGDPEALPIGVLEVCSDRFRVWSAEEQDVLAEMADAVAIALRAARRRVREQLLVDLATIFSVARPIDQTLAAVASQLAASLGGWCALSLNNGGHLRLVALMHPDPARRTATRALIGGPSISFNLPGLGSHSLARRQAIVSTLSPHDVETYARRNDTTGALARLIAPRAAHVLAVPLRLSGSPIGVLHILREDSGRGFTADETAFMTLVADRVAAAIDNARLYQATESERARLRAVLDAMADGILIFDDTGTLVEVNPGGQRLLALQALDGQESPLNELSLGLELRQTDGTPVTLDTLPSQLALRNEVLLNRTYTGVTPDGRTLDLSASAAPVLQGEHVRGAVVVLRDISAERALERHKDEFIGVASHELKTPLTSIRGHVEMVKMRLESPPSRKSDSDALQKATPDRTLASLTTVLTQVDRLISLIDDMLDLTRIQAGHLMLRPQPYDLTVLVQHIVETMRPTSDKHDLVLRGDDVQAKVEIDPGRIEQVLDNLLSNAIKYSPSGGDIEIEISCPVAVADAGQTPQDSASPRSEVVVGIRDRGTGIPKEDWPHLFERFFRSARHTSGTQHGPRVSGLGLGLYVSYTIVTRHGGRLWLADSGPEGSTFCLALPLRDGG